MKRETFTTSAPEGQVDVDRFPTDAAVESSSRPSPTRLLLAMRAVWIRRRSIARAVAAGVIFAGIVALLTPNSYKSSVRLMPPDNSSASLASMASMAGVASRFGGGGERGGAEVPGLPFSLTDLLAPRNTGATFMGILKSRTVQMNLVQQFGLRSVYGLPLLRLRTQAETARIRLEENTEIGDDRKSGIITVSVIDHDRNRAANMARAYIDQLNLLVAKLSTSSAQRERLFLEERLKGVKQDLDVAQRELSEYSSKNSALDPKEQGRAIVEATAMLQGQLIAAESELKALQAIYTDSNVRVRSVKARMSELRSQIGKVIGSNAAPGASATPNDNVPFPTMQQLPKLGVGYADLYRRVKIQEAVYQALTQQYESAKVQEAKEIPTVRVLDEANVPERKYGPHRGLVLILGGVMGLLLGMAWAIGTDLWERTDPQHPYKALASEMISTVLNSRWYMRARYGWQKTRARVRLRRFRQFDSNGGPLP